MAAPDPTPLLGPLVELAKIGFDRWDKHKDGPRVMTTVLKSVQMELNRNWSAIQEAQEPDSGPQLIDNNLTDKQLKDLVTALGKRKQLIDLLTVCYQQMPKGQTKLAAQPWTDTVRDRNEDLSGSLAQASQAITEMLVAEGLIVDRLTDADCLLPPISKMFDELYVSEDEQLRILDRWTAFCGGLRAGRCRPYRRAEVKDYLQRKDVLGAIALRKRAKQDYPEGQSFELKDGIYELWVRDRLRLLYGLDTTSSPVVLDLVRLMGPESARWTPAWRLKRAACRLAKMRGA